MRGGITGGIALLARKKKLKSAKFKIDATLASGGVVALSLTAKL